MMTDKNNHIYLLDTKWLEDEELFAAWHQKMPPERRQKTDRFRFEKDRRLSLGAGILLQHALSQAGIGENTLSYGENGKPYLTGRSDLCFNLSHSGQIAACAVSDRPVGIDIEEKRYFDEKLIQYVFLEPEITWIETHFEDADVGYTALWTMKESLMKYWGTGISLGPKKICMDLNEPIRARCEEFPSEKLFFTWVAIGDYQLTVCSDYQDFSGEPEWFIPMGERQ